MFSKQVGNIYAIFVQFHRSIRFIASVQQNGVSRMSDKELDAVKSGDKKAFDGLAEKFSPLIAGEATAAIRRSEELKPYSDEIRQEALMALYSAALSFEEGKNVTFGLYAKICIHNRIISFVRKIRSQLKKQSKGSESVENGPRKSDAPDEILDSLEKNSELKRFLNENLSAYEKKVLSLYLEKKSYTEISSSLGKTEKSVDNALFRVKSKIKKRFS